ncbi:hypothetical protein SASPL_127430 [Salvia splendens]|uniref:Disease resistance protein RPM1 n=1 Tax=Salvia splendens TaxID=180675 RepID=A0A8X8ZLT7_SALSN|nr:hypothetical protein SASPL_127430 [Salvia splendens]
MAYTVVGSLTQTIPRILSQDEQYYPISDEGKQLIDSLSNKVALLRGFLDGSKKEKASKEEAEEEGMSLETRIREAANRAEDIMEHFMYEHLKVVRSKAVVERTDILYDFRELQIVLKEINSIAEEVERIQPEISGHPTILLSETEAPIIDTVTVGLEKHDVASHACPNKDPLKMALMDEDLSFSLLKQKVFPNTELKPEMNEIAWDVAKNCGGLPLAIVLIAGILFTAERTVISWGKIAEDVKDAVEKDDKFGQRIALSYTHLPLLLRPCFLYMGGFPEDHEIRISKIFKLWIAEGFVKDENEAEGYLNSLVRRNMPTITAFKSNGKFKTCNIHDLVREMSKSKAIDENYERRMSIGHPDLTGLARGYASTLRSVICFQPNDSSLRSLRKFKLLRVLDVVDTDAYSLPTTVFDLFHLRYLAFGCPMEVPSAISRLQNLRTLIIRPTKRSRKYSTDEVCLPLEIWMMPLLTHLVSFFDLLPNPEGAASALKELLTLSVVKKLICTKEMMKLIWNVKKLAITYFGDKYQEDYQLKNLVILSQLEKLTLFVMKGSLLQVKAKPVFPETLKKLTLSGWRFPWEDMKAIAALPQLQVLKLRDHAFEGDTWDTNEECGDEDYEEAEVNLFLELKYLLIEESDLENWVTEKRHFPALERLVLKGCGKLNEIPNDIGDISGLKLIEVDRFNEPLLKCVYEIQKEQDGYARVLRVRQL